MRVQFNWKYSAMKRELCFNEDDDSFEHDKLSHFQDFFRNITLYRAL